MASKDIKKLSRKQLMQHFEQERQEWLDAGMSEADIFRIHFGDDCYKGDYTVWLGERKHHRSDRKYSPGTPASLDGAEYGYTCIADNSAADDLLDLEQTADIETALQVLSSKERALVQTLVFDGITCAEYAEINGLNKSTVSRNLERARKKLKKFL